MTPTRRPSRRGPIVGLVALLLLAAPRAAGQEEEKQKEPRDLAHFNLGKDGLALQGYDPVAYFPEGGKKPKKGRDTIQTTHEGVVYRFASDENRKRFLADPAKYEPQYGGWCAYAMADGDKVGIDPESFLVTDGKLYLFFKAWYADTRAKWRKDEVRLRSRADETWKALHEARPK